MKIFFAVVFFVILFSSLKAMKAKDTLMDKIAKNPIKYLYVQNIKE